MSSARRNDRARSRAHAPRLRRASIAGVTLACGALAATLATRADARPAPDRPVARAAAAPAAATPAAVVLQDSLKGRSGKLLARFITSTRSNTLPFLRELFGDKLPSAPGVYAVPGAQAAGKQFAFITMLPFTEKAGSRIGTYRIGFWPGEKHAPRSRAYANPEGFIRVTAENQLTYVSEHFRLRDFLTKDQQNVWPKYLVLQESLLDKLELAIDDLNARGIAVTHVQVMSGFRTPQYNAGGGNTAGRANDSRHTYGDAADVFVDNDRNGRMDDLNRDGRVTRADAEILAAAVERVERAHPDLVGGIGIYKATSAHAGFVHVDVRGTRARWG
jgi:uncharacterized protein YcbK (DUF882 family)